MHASRAAILAVLILASHPAATAPATAQQQDDYEFGMLTIKNETENVVVQYQVRWGTNSNWVNYKLKPGEQKNHYHKLDAEGRHPQPYVRFNELVNQVDSPVQSYKLLTIATFRPLEGTGVVYAFRTKNGGAVAAFYLIDHPAELWRAP
jgi:hypothetical protein